MNSRLMSAHTTLLSTTVSLKNLYLDPHLIYFMHISTRISDQRIQHNDKTITFMLMTLRSATLWNSLPLDIRTAPSMD